MPERPDGICGMPVESESCPDHSTVCAQCGREDAPAGPDTRLDLDAIRDRANAATKGPWGVEHEGGVMVLNRGTCQAVAFVGSEGDDQVRADSAFLAAAREDVPALLAEVDRLTTELAAANQVANDALTLAEQAAADRRSLRTQVDRLRRLLETRDADYALVVRVGDDGRAQMDARSGITIGQCATWLREIATDTIRRALR
jgi:hypothetical protein